MKKKMFLGKARYLLRMYVVIVLCSIIWLGGSGKGGGSGSGSGNCAFIEKNDKLAVFVSFQNNFLQLPTGCQVPDVGSNPITGGSDYNCTIRVRSTSAKCGKYYDKIYNFPTISGGDPLLEPPYMVRTLRDEFVIVRVTFFESCNQCVPFGLTMSSGKKIYEGEVQVSNRTDYTNVPLKYTRTLSCE
jgi:hypothetical protein